MHHLFILFSLIPFYILGAIPSGYLIAKSKGINISKHGSGNVGATNVSRVLGKKLGALTLLLDCSKGFIALFLANLLFPSVTFLGAVAIATVSGHCFSIPRYLPGGKGVATTLGVGLFISPLAALSSVVVFALIAFCTRIVSLASLIAIAAAPIAADFFNTPDTLIAALAIIAMIVAFKHKSNLVRLSQGTENQFDAAKETQV
jgi:acyl phosphate:glycerol-3-phosphate acyltransferase